MSVDMLALLKAHGVPIADAGDKHTGSGWINTACPFCGDRSFHLGWNVSGQYFTCWKCGGHRTDDTLSTLLGISEAQAWILRKRYALRPAATQEDVPEEIVRPAAVIVPGHDLNAAHRKYLADRGYDAERLAVWQLQGTDHTAAGTDKFRIVCPVYYADRVVSWQGRDITGRSPLRWKSCPQHLEARDHKHCIGGQQLVPGNSVAVVEGFTDAWRLGPGAVTTFGTAYLSEQVNLLRAYRRRFIVLDSADKDPNAGRQADRLAAMLSAFPGETFIHELDAGDPGDLSQDDADYLMEHEWRIR